MHIELGVADVQFYINLKSKSENADAIANFKQWLKENHPDIRFTLTVTESKNGTSPNAETINSYKFIFTGMELVGEAYETLEEFENDVQPTYSSGGIGSQEQFSGPKITDPHTEKADAIVAKLEFMYNQGVITGLKTRKKHKLVQAIFTCTGPKNRNLALKQFPTALKEHYNAKAELNPSLTTSSANPDTIGWDITWY